MDLYFSLYEPLDYSAYYRYSPGQEPECSLMLHATKGRSTAEEETVFFLFFFYSLVNLLGCKTILFTEFVLHGGCHA